MKRNVDLNEISDGRLYTANDMVKANCYDCEGCSACCRGMGVSIILDPMDIARLQEGLALSFEEMTGKYIELQVVDALVLPNLKMDGEEEVCAFLNEEGRCSIYTLRPGICRLFPLGRYYEETGFRYFLQVHECRKNDRGKIKVKKWLDIPDLKQYETYINEWHTFLVKCEEALGMLTKEQIRILTLYVLKTFYQMPYPEGRFYEEFSRRLADTYERLGI